MKCLNIFCFIMIVFLLSGCVNGDSNFIIFDVLDDQTYAVIGFKKEKKITFEIPKYYKGKLVTQISDEAFKNNTALKQIIIPDSIVNIGNSAFENCIFLESMVIPNGVINIGDYAFKNCTSLKSIYIPKSVTTIGNDIFYNCESLYVYCEIDSLPNSWIGFWDWDFLRGKVIWAYSIDLKDEVLFPRTSSPLISTWSSGMEDCR